MQTTDHVFSCQNVGFGFTVWQRKCFSGKITYSHALFFRNHLSSNLFFLYIFGECLFLFIFFQYDQLFFLSNNRVNFILEVHEKFVPKIENILLNFKRVFFLLQQESQLKKRKEILLCGFVIFLQGLEQTLFHGLFYQEMQSRLEPLVLFLVYLQSVYQ